VSIATQKTIQKLKPEYYVGNVERYIAPIKQRKDLFGIIDIIAMNNIELIGIQVCTTKVQEHIRTIYDNEQVAITWLQHAKLEIWAWRKLKLKRGSKAYRWKLRIIYFYLDNNKLKHKEKGG